MISHFHRVTPVTEEIYWLDTPFALRVFYYGLACADLVQAECCTPLYCRQHSVAYTQEASYSNIAWKQGAIEGDS